MGICLSSVRSFQTVSTCCHFFLSAAPVDWLSRTENLIPSFPSLSNCSWKQCKLLSAKAAPQLEPTPQTACALQLLPAVSSCRPHWATAPTSLPPHCSHSTKTPPASSFQYLLIPWYFKSNLTHDGPSQTFAYILKHLKCLV